MGRGRGKTLTVDEHVMENQGGSCEPCKRKKCKVIPTPQSAFVSSQANLLTVRPEIVGSCN